MEMQQRTERLQFEVSTLCCKLVAYTCLRRRFITLTNIVISTSFIIASNIKSAHAKIIDQKRPSKKLLIIENLKSQIKTFEFNLH